ncbi:unnamed protein product [Gongylonema pulchrum]|uniref:Condensin complex subunit 2 n=1 Tax=Gongylonema pulchrum TaxID=637853 RepID=A0A183CWR8_9BILA|nr:unnamed protein product [Gongylonema pulchrum]
MFIAEAGSVVKGKPVAKPCKPERRKVKKEEEISALEDSGSLPFDLIRKRLKKMKHEAIIVKEDQVLKTIRNPVSPDMYMTEQGGFELGLEKPFSPRSEDDQNKHEAHLSLLRQSILDELVDTGCSAEKHLALFNGYFDDELERRSASASVVRSTDDIFEAHVGDDNDDIDHRADVCADDVGGGSGEEIADDNDDTRIIRVYDVLGAKAMSSFCSEAEAGADEAEIFGVKYSVRQRRINAPAVKRAIGSILSNPKEMNDDPTCELRHAEVAVTDFQLSGRHTFSSVVARLPSYVAGRTADDLSPINAFSVLLHLCNENNLELLQRKNENGLIKESGMGDFTIVNARKKDVNYKHTTSEHR